MDAQTIYRRLRTLGIAIPLTLLTGMLAGQTSSSPLPSPPQEQMAAPAENTPEAPPTGSPQSPPSPVQPEARSIYPHKQAQVPSAATVPPLVGNSAKGPDENVQTLHVIVGRSVFINTPERLRRVYISNPSVIDSMTPSPKDLVITAKIAGTSSIVLWDENGTSTVLTVLADVDVGGLRESLSQALPADQISVEVQEGKLFLSGAVGSDTEADIAARLAAVYSKQIVNALVVEPRHKPQVQLKVRFAELDRTKLTSFGINLLSLNKNTASSSTGQFSPPAFPQVGGSAQSSAIVSDVLNLFYFNVPHGLGFTLKDLQTRGILEVLAEPTLTTIDGVPAKFLAGGEFPFPIVQPGSAGGTATVTIQFRPYGVKLEFTPYVNPDGTIRLKVMPEVSALDYSNVVVIAGYTIPSLSTRKAETEVELKDGQTFGISGILDRRTTDNLNKMPGIADIPILGQLFRSKNLNHSVMELVVVVTPTIVDPLTSGQPPPANPEWVTPPGQLGNFDQGFPKSYNPKP